jgi:hypothetical protein
MCYLPFKMDLSLKTLVRLHLDGQRLCNSDYIKAPLQLFRIIGYYSGRLRFHGFLRPRNPREKEICLKQSKKGKEIYANLLSGK